MHIPLYIPYVAGREHEYIARAISQRKFSGHGPFAALCEQHLGRLYGVGRCFMTDSCTSALHMAAISCGIGPGDEVIVPSYTYVSTALAFSQTGARLRFADSLPGHPNMDCGQMGELINPNTRAIVPVHYGGVGCDMDALGELAAKHSLVVIEDAAHCFGAPLSDRAAMSCLSFHETKNIHCGEGGMLLLHDEGYASRIETVWQRGTNRLSFLRNEADRYQWVSPGGAFMACELSAAFLYAQLEAAEQVMEHRNALWEHYLTLLAPLQQAGKAELSRERGSAHIFYLVCNSEKESAELIESLSRQGITASTHYPCLHLTPFGRTLHDGRSLPNAERFAGALVRLPLYHDLTEAQVEFVATQVKTFYGL